MIFTFAQYSYYPELSQFYLKLETMTTQNRLASDGLSNQAQYFQVLSLYG